jgi:hypothetical protein
MKALTIYDMYRTIWRLREKQCDDRINRNQYEEEIKYWQGIIDDMNAEGEKVLWL